MPALRLHPLLITTTGTPDLSGSGPCGSARSRINPAFRLTSLSLCVVVSRCAQPCVTPSSDLATAQAVRHYRLMPHLFLSRSLSLICCVAGLALLGTESRSIAAAKSAAAERKLLYVATPGIRDELQYSWDR